ncbi:MAG: 50S ribosomal protein L5 [Candidatus Thermoplasmatota archaeon]|nr:50S ribosomal protein L5 [Candidatus Thermoplasmatota archaeon]
MNENTMRMPRIAKVVVNIGVGEGGEKLIKAEKVLRLLTDRKPIRTLAKVTNKEWNLKPSMPIGCKVTLRGNDAIKFLKNALWVRDNKIPRDSFDNYGNFSFGIPDYTDFPEMKYDPGIGIFGMDVNVRLVRAGERVATRKRARAKIPKKHRVTAAEAMEYIKSNFGVEIIE